MRTYKKGSLAFLDDNQIYVFGSNTQGRHGKGSALWAKLKAGAIYGQAKGPQGNAYAIITKDISTWPYKSITKDNIQGQIILLYHYAAQNPELEFVVAYSGHGTNLNGYTPAEMAEMFNCAPIPDNFVFEESFYKLLKL